VKEVELDLPFLALPPGLGGAMATMERRLRDGEKRRELGCLRNWREKLGLEDKLRDEGLKKDEDNFVLLEEGTEGGVLI